MGGMSRGHVSVMWQCLPHKHIPYKIILGWHFDKIRTWAENYKRCSIQSASVMLSRWEVRVPWILLSSNKYYTGGNHSGRLLCSRNIFHKDLYTCFKFYPSVNRMFCSRCLCLFVYRTYAHGCYETSAHAPLFMLLLTAGYLITKKRQYQHMVFKNLILFFTSLNYYKPCLYTNFIDFNYLWFI
jgi:hypothetical protein